MKLSRLHSGGLAWSLPLLVSATVSSQVFITEFMASNSRTLADKDGEYSDWIEIYNANTNAVNLDGWYLTDSTGGSRR